MKAAYSVALLLLVAIFTSPANAQDGNVSQSTLSQIGLGGMQMMTDAEGLQIRGMSSWSSSGGGRIVSGGLIYNSGNRTYFVFAGSANSAGSGSNGYYGSSARHRQGSRAGATLYVGPRLIPIASFGGGAGGYGYTGAR